MADKSWQLRVGERGTSGSDPVTEVMRMNLANKQKQDMERESELDDLDHSEKMLKKQVNVSELEKQSRGENEMVKELKAEREKREKAQEELGEEKRTHAEDKLGTKIGNLEDMIKANSGQIEEFKNVAKELRLAEPKSGGGVSDSVELQIAKMRRDQELAIAKMQMDNELAIEEGRDARSRREEEIRDARSRQEEERRDARSWREAEWDLSKEKFREERELTKELKREEVQGNLAVKREQIELIRGIPEHIGRVIVSATMSGGGGNSGGIAGQAGQIGQAIEAGEGEFGEVQCPNTNCGSIIAIAKDAAQAICTGCGTKYPIKRIMKAVEAVEAVEEEVEV